jgi:signal transduction histidine kinase
LHVSRDCEHLEQDAGRHLTRLLHQGEAGFRGVLEKLPAAAYTCDREGLITYFNRHAIVVWGRAPLLNDPRDRFCGSFKLFTTDGAPIRHEECWMALALRDDREYNGCEILIERPDGSRVTALAHANPLHDENGVPIGAVNVLVDITERKQMEESLRKADRHKDEFLAILAHELRGPLAPVRNSLEIIKRAQGDANLVGQATATMDRQLSQMERLIDDLLDVSRIAENKLELRKQSTSLASVVSRAVETCTPLAHELGHRIDVDLPTEPMELHADPARLAQVFSNLLNNACRYTDRGGSIRLSAERSGGVAVVTVADDGVGIAPDVLPHIFEMFMQAHPMGGRVHGGMGLGLALVRRLLHLHDGTIEAFSEGLQKGSRFVIRLPLREERAPAPLLPARQSPRSGPRRILVVDDDRDSALSLALLLEISGTRQKWRTTRRARSAPPRRFGPT